MATKARLTKKELEAIERGYGLMEFSRLWSLRQACRMFPLDFVIKTWHEVNDPIQLEFAMKEADNGG